MQKFRSALAAVALFAVASLAYGGTLDAFKFYPSAAAAIKSPQVRVSYFEDNTALLPANDTQVGFIVGDLATGKLLEQQSGNTLNRVTITFEARIANPNETFKFRDPQTYLEGVLPSACAWDKDNIAAPSKTITCTYRQTRMPFDFPAFIVFFDAPSQAPGSFTGDGITATLRIEYAEDPVGGDRNNSSQAANPLFVALGTQDPVDVRTAVSNAGTSIHSGDFGIPKPKVTVDGIPIDKRNAELVVIPALPLPGQDPPPQIAAARILITTRSGSSTDPDFDETCVNLANYRDCPTFETQVLDARALGTPAVVFTDPDQPLKTIYRIDASNLKRSLPQTLANTLIYYSADNGVTLPFRLVSPVCVNGEPNTGADAGLPCVLSKQCFANLAATSRAYGALGRNVDLVGDCEWVLLNRSNGFTRFQ